MIVTLSDKGISSATDALLKDLKVYAPPATMRKVILAYLEAAQAEKVAKKVMENMD